jgi:hypothetical protein
MRIESELTHKDYQRIMFSLAGRKPITIILLVLGFSLTAASVLFFLGFNIPFQDPPYLQLFLGLFIIFLYPLFFFLSVRKTYKTHLRLQERIVYEFNQDKIIVTGETFKSEMDWSKIYRIVEFKNWILIYQNKLIANIVKKESFGPDIQHFRDLAKRNNIKLT